MVHRCFNPGCQREMKLLSDGSLYSFERRNLDTEFFWLCSDCSAVLELGLDPTGGIVLRPRGLKGYAQPPHPDRDLRQVSLSKPVQRSDDPAAPWRPGFGWVSTREAA